MDPINVSPYPSGSGDDSREDRVWAVLCHLSTFITVFFLANFVVPLAIWIAKRDSSPFVADQGKEVLNFQITMLIGYGVAILCFVSVVLIPLAILLAIILPLWHIVFSIIGAIKAFDGQRYRYPLTLRMI